MRPAAWRAVVVRAAALAAVLLLVWGATAGPLQVIGEWRDVPAQTDESSDEPRFDLGDPPSTVLSDEEVEQGRGQAWLQDVIDMLALATALVALAWLARMALSQLRLPQKRQVIEDEPLPDADRARDVLARSRDDQERALEQGEPAEGIIACWVAPERAAEDAGIPRLASETPTEFVVRLLHGLDVDPRPVAALAWLYHEARFSSHRMGPEARDRARASLAAIHADLRLVAG